MFSSVGGWIVKDTDAISGVESATHQRFSSFFMRSQLSTASLTTPRFTVSILAVPWPVRRSGNCYCSLLESALLEVTRHFTGFKSVTKTFELFFCPESLFKVIHNRQNITFREHHFPVILQGCFFLHSCLEIYFWTNVATSWCGGQE